MPHPSPTRRRRQVVNLTGLRRRLRHCLDTMGVSPRAFSEGLGLGHGAAQYLLSKTVNDPRLSSAVALAEGLSCSLDWLVHGRGSAPTPDDLRAARERHDRRAGAGLAKTEPTPAAEPAKAVA